MTTLETVRDQRTGRVNSVSTLVPITENDSHAFYDAGEKLGAWTLKPYSRPIKNEDGFVHLEYAKTRSGEDFIDETGNKQIINSLNEIMVFNRETDSYEAIPYVSTKKNHVIVDHNRLVHIMDNWVGVGAIPELLYLSPDKATLSGIAKVPDLFPKFSGLDEIYGKIVFQNNIAGQKRFGMKFAAERYVCVNMIYFTGKNDEISFSTKHTKKVETRITERIELQHERIREIAFNMENTFVELANVNMNENQTVDFLRKFLVKANKNIPARTLYSDLGKSPELYRKKVIVDQNVRAISEIASGNGRQGNTTGSTGGSAYGVYQAILENSDWYRDGSETARSYQTTRDNRSLQAIGIDDAMEHYKKHALTAIGLEVDSITDSYVEPELV